MSTREELETRGSSLATAKQILLEKRQQKIASIKEGAESIPRRPPDAPVPASFAQQRVWFIHQLKPDNAAYHEMRAFRAGMLLDAQVLRRALVELMRRHDILRSSFAFVNGQLQQIVHPYEDADTDLALLELDLAQTPEAAREQEAQRAISAEVKRPFELAKGLPWRNLFIRVSETETIFVTIVHHILCDGWGLDIFERELQTLYMAFLAGQPSPLPEPELQYADFACWEQQRSRGDFWKQQLAYWRQTLANVSDRPLLYGDHPRQVMQDASRATLTFSVPASVTKDLRDLSSREGISLFIILLAAFQLLLFQYSERDDIIVGTPISRRSKPELEQIIGCFLNMLVLRTDMSGDPTFLALLQRVRTTSLGAYANQDVPFEQLVADLAPERSKNRNPFFQIMLDFQNDQQGASTPSETATAASNSATDVSQLDCIMRLWDRGAELAGEIFYPAELFDASTIESLRDNFLALLTLVAADPTQPLSALFILTARDREKIATWNLARLNDVEEQPRATGEDEGPSTPLEEILVEVWTQILDLEWVGIHDNFFKIGGHSLLATQLLAQVQSVLDIEIPLQLVFDAPTIADFAEALLKDEDHRERIEKTIELLLSVTELSEDEVAEMLVVEG